MHYKNLLNNQLQELESYIYYIELINSNISNASIGWHIYHCLKVINVVCTSTINSDPNVYKWQFNVQKLICFTFKYFPRGKAKSPKSVLPPQKIESNDIQIQLMDARKNINAFNALDRHANVTHHIFGMLNKKETQKFLTIHNEHHLKIIRDILKTKS